MILPPFIFFPSRHLNSDIFLDAGSLTPVTTRTLGLQEAVERPSVQALLVWTLVLMLTGSCLT